MTCEENIHPSFSKSLPEAHSGYKVKSKKPRVFFCIDLILLKSQKTSDYRFHPTLFLIHHQIRHAHPGYPEEKRKRIMQSSHDALHILSNWFVTSLFYRWIRCIKQTTPSSSRPRGRYRRDFFAFLRSEYQVRLSRTFSAISTAECGLRQGQI